jgi:hypothetical protein
MKNRSVAIGQKTLMYVKAYRQIAGSVTATILFGRLEFWFDRFPDGFYKFLDPSPGNKRYTKGDSWTEELEYSKDEFRTAFDYLGIRYPNFADYEATDNPFLKIPRQMVAESRIEMLYCSYYDRLEGLTFYYRNHDLVDRKLEEINLRPSRQRQHGQNGFPQGDHLGDANMPISAMPTCPSRDCLDDHVGDANMLPFSINTHGTDSLTTTTTTRKRERGVVVDDRVKVSVYKAPQFLAYALSPEGKGIHAPQLWAVEATYTTKYDPVLAAWLACQPPIDATPETPMPGDLAPGILEQFLSGVSHRVDHSTFKDWFLPIKAASRDGDTIYFRVPEVRFQTYIGHTYRKIVEDVVEAMGLIGYTVEFIL